jgi:chromosomal replication initiator protein
LVSSVQSISFGSSDVSLGSNSTQTGGCAREVPEFFFGPENALLGVSVEPLIRSGTCPFRPLVLVGPSGVGKSHLASGIATTIADGKSIVQFTAADFARQVTETTSPVEAAEHHRSLHQAETLILEDLHQLAKKPAAQIALASLLDALVARHATVIITSNCLPAKLENFTPALVDRLSSGLVVSLAPPSKSVRRAMITHIADREQLNLSSGAADRLAEAELNTWNELRGALLELRFVRGQDGSSIRLTDVRRYLAEQPAPHAIEIREIALAVAKHFSLRLGDLQSASRRRGVVDARNITAYLTRQSTGQSLQQIGQFLGGRDHTTILHGIRKFEQQLSTDPAQRQLVEDLKHQIQPQANAWKNCRPTVRRSSSSDGT